MFQKMRGRSILVLRVCINPTAILPHRSSSVSPGGMVMKRFQVMCAKRFRLKANIDGFYTSKGDAKKDQFAISGNFPNLQRQTASRYAESSV